MEMGGLQDQVLESLDSLWFFSNVFSSTTTPLRFQKLENPTQINVEEPSREEIATICLVLQNQQNESHVGENLALIQMRYGDGVGGFPSEVRTEVELESESPNKATEKEDQKRRRRRSRGCLSQRRQILGEIDLSFAVKEVSEHWLFEQRNEYRRTGGQIQNKMPPFDDRLAMKEHIKSWAYAVACTVR